MPSQFAQDGTVSPFLARNLCFHNKLSLYQSFNALVAGFSLYLQSSPCSMELVKCYSNNVSEHFATYTTFIILSDIRVVLIVNQWYASEHYYFRNIPSIQKRYTKRIYADVCTSPTFMLVSNFDVKGVFLLTEERLPNFGITKNTTFFSHM